MNTKLTIESVIQLSEDQIRSLLTKLNLDSKKIEIDNRINPSLIGGIRIMYQGKVIDLSFKSKLNQLS